MANSDYLNEVMELSGTTLSPKEFVQGVNLVYHETGASGYDASHDYIWTDVGRLWREMLRVAGVLHTSSGIEILDFGSGTGFAAVQVTRWLPPGSITRIVLIEPSYEMANIALKRITELGVKVDHFPALGNVDPGEKFDIVCENSVLHHLPDPHSSVRGLARRVSSKGTLIFAHEPNLRFQSGPVWILNSGARRLLKLGRRRKQPKAKTSTMSRVNDHLLAKGIISNPIPDEDVGLIVDYWVPRPWHPGRRNEALGFSPRALHKFAGHGFLLAFCRTYDHLGRPRSHLPGLLKLIDSALAFCFPSRGQHFAVAFRRGD